ncbi:RhtB (resistance to homoserine/threonine) family protein [Pasteurella langaaensis DSM 22999]|uniref:RhtB (Resistance to homoserine/threonine) family protein n=1 Tax=Alitibacter langaaensis DSM 22999 TaxID=1122935 RepID=A0A2U0TAF7_9PAST|nr:homoserine/threonine efflux transporter [Pasteurella langaaensis]PVX40605.1 RhtB (resistance to homoserine/threonine) family protein [Pasteurella langaaensis DSM 22999]
MINLIIVHFFGLITPGPDFFYVTRMAASNSHRNTVCGVIGITLGVAFWALAAMLGLATLFATMPLSHGIIMILGGGYLMYLGYLMARSRKNVVFQPMTETEMNQSTTIKKEIMKGLFVNLSNAKAVVYFASVMSLILVNITETWHMVMAFLIIVVETFIYFYSLALLFSRPAAKRFYSQYSRYIDNAAGVIFLGFGAFLVYSGVAEISV